MMILFASNKIVSSEKYLKQKKIQRGGGVDKKSLRIIFKNIK